MSGPKPTVSRFTLGCAKLAFWSSATFILLLSSLHLLRPDLDPSWQFISMYELGPFGWVMQLAFFCLAASCLGLCGCVTTELRGFVGWIGVILVLIAAAGMAVAGIYVPDPVNKLHEIGAQMDHVPFGAPLINWGLSRNPAWKPARRMLLTTAFLPLLGLILFIGSLIVMLPLNDGKTGPQVLVGWPNRVMILLHCAWLMPVAWNMISRGATPAVVPASEAADGGR